MLPMVVLVVLIVVNLGLLFLLFRPDQALTAEPADQDRGEGALPAPRSSPTMTPSPSAPTEQTTSPSPSASKKVRRRPPNQSSQLLRNGCSSLYLPRLHGGRRLATAILPERSSGRPTLALAGN